MNDGAAVAALDLSGQAFHIVPGADLIVDHHAGHKDGVFVHMVQHPVNVQRAVRAGVHHGHIIAHGGQTLQRLLHAEVLKAGHHDALAEPAGQGRAQQGHVVALAAAGGKIELPALAAQGAGTAARAAFRASSLRAPGAYRLDGLAQCSRMALLMTSATSGATMVVAALSDNAIQGFAA